MASPSSSEFFHVIDWTEAMEQCGDDEDFLRELLSDLRGEIDAQIVKMDEVLENPMNEQSFLLIMRASHVIKGASSNLMCKELNETAKNLEQSAASGNGVESGASDELEKATQDVKDKYSELKKAVDNYYAFLDSVDV